MSDSFFDSRISDNPSKHQSWGVKIHYFAHMWITGELRKNYVICYAFLRPFYAFLRPFYGWYFRYGFGT